MKIAKKRSQFKTTTLSKTRNKGRLFVSTVYLGYSWDLCFFYAWNGKVKERESLYTRFKNVTEQEMGLDDIGVAESVCEIAKHSLPGMLNLCEDSC